MILPSSSKGLVSKETVAGEFHSRVAATLVCPREISSLAFKVLRPRTAPAPADKGHALFRGSA